MFNTTLSTVTIPRLLGMPQSRTHRTESVEGWLEKVEIMVPRTRTCSSASGGRELISSERWHFFVSKR